MNRAETMKRTELKAALLAATDAARQAGDLMRRHLRLSKKITEAQQHDIKLELDVRCQKLIQRRLRAALPCPVLGEEGIVGDPQAVERWVVDPIDGTVNFTYGIPHACVSIALQERADTTPKSHGHTEESYTTIAGVVYDPFCDELWTAVAGEPARLNGRIIRVSTRRRLDEAIISVGFAKQVHTLEQMLPVLNQLIRRVRKIRLMGAAALAMTYVASGRFDAYLETGIRLWDIAAGGLILEAAGGDFWRKPVAGDYSYLVVANNGPLRRQLRDYMQVVLATDKR